MGLERVETTLGKEIIAWVRASGSKSLLATRPVKVNTAGLRLAPQLETDTVSIAKKVESWLERNPSPPVAKQGFTDVSGHHGFHGINGEYNLPLEQRTSYLLDRIKPDTPEKIQKITRFAEIQDAQMQCQILEYNKEFKALMPQPRDCVVYRGRSCQIGSPNSYDLNIIKNAKIGDEIIPTRGFAYAAHQKRVASQWFSRNQAGFEGILYEIRVPKGSQISVNMEHGGEAVFPGFSRYKLISKETRYIKSYADEFKHTGEVRPYNHVVLEYIPDIPTKVSDEVMQLAQKPLF